MPFKSIFVVAIGGSDDGGDDIDCTNNRFTGTIRSIGGGSQVFYVEFNDTTAADNAGSVLCYMNDNRPVAHRVNQPVRPPANITRTLP